MIEKETLHSHVIYQIAYSFTTVTYRAPHQGTLKRFIEPANVSLSDWTHRLLKSIPTINILVDQTWTISRHKRELLAENHILSLIYRKWWNNILNYSMKLIMKIRLCFFHNVTNTKNDRIGPFPRKVLQWFRWCNVLLLHMIQ